MSKKDKKSGGLTSISGGKSGGGDATGGSPTRVVDLTSVRAQRNLDNRRSVERYFLNHMIDVVCEFEGVGQLPVEVVEVSETGCSFRISTAKAEQLPRDTSGHYLPIRAKFYFSRDSYLLVGLNIVNSTADIGGGGHSTRFGCSVDQTFASSQAYRQFARFLQAYSEAASRDLRHAGAF